MLAPKLTRTLFPPSQTRGLLDASVSNIYKLNAVLASSFRISGVQKDIQQHGCIIWNSGVFRWILFILRSFVSLSAILCLFLTSSFLLQVKKTTPLWCGSGFMRARPSAAHPVAPTTNWCHTKSPINGSLIPHVNNTALRISFKYSFDSFRTRWLSDNVSMLQKVNFTCTILVLPTSRS